MAQRSAKDSFVLPLPVQFLAAWIGVWVGRRQQAAIDYLREENRALREKLGPGRIRLTEVRRRRLAELGKRLGRRGLAGVATLASPDTVLRWYRELVARKYDGSARRKPGRPKKSEEIVRLLLEMARRNTRWGYTRMQGALKNLGYKVGRSTIRNILKAHGIEPAPIRGRLSWATFLRAHLGVLAAADFFTIEVLGLSGLVRHFVFFVMDVATRKVEIAGITATPTGKWMEQIARNLVDADDGFLLGKRRLIVDRDSLYTREFMAVLERGGVKVQKLPAKSPNLNAFAERFIWSIKSECLNHIVPLGEGHLRRVVTEYAKHYHHERNHQGLENKLIENLEPANTNNRIARRERVGGLLNFYYREAA